MFERFNLTVDVKHMIGILELSLELLETAITAKLRFGPHAGSQEKLSIAFIDCEVNTHYRTEVLGQPEVTWFSRQCIIVNPIGQV